MSATTKMPKPDPLAAARHPSEPGGLRPGNPRIPCALACALVFSVLLLPACSNAPSRVSMENDRLREENLALTRQVETMKRDIQLRLGEIEALRKQAGTTPKVYTADVLVVAGIKFDRYTGPIDTNHDGKDDTLRVYLYTLDQKGRFLVASGQLNLQAAVLTAGAEPRIVADLTLTPEQMDKAYRTGLTGSHYRLETPIPAGLDHLAVRVTFTDATTGATFTHEQSFKVQ